MNTPTPFSAVPPIEMQVRERQMGGVDTWEIETGCLTWHFCRRGGGLAGLRGPDGVEWIDFDRERPGPRGEYRGFPNLVHQQNIPGGLHPLNIGTRPAVSRIVQQDAAGVEILTEVAGWEARFRFTPDHVRLRLETLPAGARYWVLFEGTPAGAGNAEDWGTLTADGVWHGGGALWNAPLPDGWIALASAPGARGLILAHPVELHPISSCWWMEAMCVCGLGRDAATSKNKQFRVPLDFHLGWVEHVTMETCGETLRRWRNRPEGAVS